MDEKKFEKLDKKIEKKNLIADAAAEIFLEKGYLNTHIIDIAKKAGLGKGTVYEYFESKESILMFILDTRLLKEYEDATATVAAAEGAMGKLNAYIDTEAGFVERYGRYAHDFQNSLAAQTVEITEDIMRRLMAVVTMKYKSALAIVEEGIKEGIFKDDNPHFLTIVMQSQVQAYLIFKLDLGKDCLIPPNMEYLAQRDKLTREDFMDILLTGLSK